MPETRPLGLIAGRRPGQCDGQIVAALRRAAELPGGLLWRVGFRTERGVLYRRAAVYGLAQLMSLLIQMDALGFEDEMLFEDRPRASCDLIFRPARESDEQPGRLG